jgi:hypothetical protein
MSVAGDVQTPGALRAFRGWTDVEVECFVSVLTDHALIEIRCDEATRTDTPVCNCGLVSLGSHPSVGKAKAAWAIHVYGVLRGDPQSDSRDAPTSGEAWDRRRDILMALAGDVQTLRTTLFDLWSCFQTVDTTAWRNEGYEALDRLVGELQRLQDAEEGLVCSWCGDDFEPGDWSSTDCCSCDPIQLSGLPGSLKDARREAEKAVEAAGNAEESLAVAEARLQAAKHALRLLEAMRDPAWWRETVDVNGEYETTRARGYYEVIGDIEAALSGPEEVNEPGDRASTARIQVADVETEPPEGNHLVSTEGDVSPGSLTSPGGAPSGETATE